MTTSAATISMSRGRQFDLSSPTYYEDMLNGIAQEILRELSELEKLDLNSLGEEDLEQVVGITQIRLLNELYFCLGQLKAKELDVDVKRAIQDLRDVWNRYIDRTQRPAVLKFQVEPDENRLQ
jgi:hypothetical protein